MSINPFGHILGPLGNYPSSEMFLQSEYKDLFTHFLCEPNHENANQFYDFLNTNRTELEGLAAQTNPGGDWKHLFSDLTGSLHDYIHGSVSPVASILDASSSLMTSLKINYSSDNICKDFLKTVNLFITAPNTAVAKCISWVLTNPDYLEAITSKSHNPSSCSHHALSVEKSIDAYLGNPDHSKSCSNLISALETLESDF